MMTADDVRKRFLDFFAKKGHAIVRSDSLVPKDDPTVLFTTAGMQQFKRQFLGQIDSFTRAATCQKCLRTDDLDVVGKTAFHHTFFEMLGNFSFGDYFKKEAISWGWEFLTQELKIPKEKLWVSVYKDDAQAEAIWLNDVKIPKDRIVRLGDKSNFWPSEAKEKGPNGPCGPCSEIFYDYGVNPNCPKKDQCDPDCSCGRFSEVWNLVFTQFNRKDGGVLEPLPNKNIDTGMGLERLVAVAQGKKTNYETDLFQPILQAIDQTYSPKADQSRNRLVVADHLRAIVFAINDGVIPSNKDRGSVIKKLIFTVKDITLRSFGSSKPVCDLVSRVVGVMKNQYPELSQSEKQIKDFVKATEDAYALLLHEKVPELEKEIKRIKEDSSLQAPLKIMALGQLMFLYRDTHGLSLDGIRDVLTAVGISSTDQQEALKVYTHLMEEQQNRSRLMSKMTGDVFADAQLNLKDVPKTKFLGYESFQGTGRILKMFKGSAAVKSLGVGDEVKIILDQTPFYAESGGQIGDTGTFRKGDSTIQIVDTQKTSDVFIHTGQVIQGSFSLEDSVQTQIDEPRRLSIMRNHTATHLLQAALRKVLGSHVQQQGSLVAEDRLRFDFTHHQAISRQQIAEIEAMINAFVMNCDSVDKKVMSLNEAKSSGALAFFAEKYGETVRVVSVDGYSKEFCGGTHLNYTGQIGLFKITTESAIAQGIRRIEAVTGDGAMNFILGKEKQLDEIAALIKAPVKEVVSRVDTQSKRLKDLEKEIETLRLENIKSSLDAIIANAIAIGETRLIIAAFKNVDAGILRKISDLLKQKVQSLVVVLGATQMENAFILISVSNDLVQKGVKANELIQTIAPLIGGTGGGRPDLAQAGSKEIQKIEFALDQARQIILEKVRV